MALITATATASEAASSAARASWWLNVSYPWTGGLYTSGFNYWYPSTSYFGYYVSLPPVVTVPQQVNVARRR